MAVSVTFENVSKRFGNVLALDTVSIEIRPGELFFLLGPSGCGKTTLLRCLAGFCDPDAGQVRIDGDDMTHCPPHRRDTGMVFQSYALWPHMTVRENVTFGLEMRGLARAEIDARTRAALDRVHMADRADHRPHQLSGGQQQRVALARALVVQPRCLLLDEPLSNLDAKLRLDMRSEIRRICKDAGLTAVYVTHDQKEALSVADRLAVLHAGRVRQVGAPEEVYRRPVDAFVAGFIGETNLLDARLLDAGPGGETRVLTPIGALTGSAAAAPLPPAGAAVTVCVRPEAIRFDPAVPGAPNAFAGALRDSVYQGELARHWVTLPIDPAARRAGIALPSAGDGVTLKVCELNPRRIARERGVPTAVHVDPEDVVVLPAQPPNEP
jgi:iron(III) transport system ATP-binding protein